jgi:hypothetical protein
VTKRRRARSGVEIKGNSSDFINAPAGIGRRRQTHSQKTRSRHCRGGDGSKTVNPENRLRDQAMGGRNGGAPVPAGIPADCGGKIGDAGEIQSTPNIEETAGIGLAAWTQPQSACWQQ